MLVENHKTNSSPFYFKGSENKNSIPVTPKRQENNRERGFRRAGNACEIAAGACLNSAVIFTFHLLQVHPLGLVLAVGVSHFYFTAAAVGEKSFPVLMVGCAGSLSCLCAISEPLGEWWEAKISISSANEEIAQIYQPAKNILPGWFSVIAITVLLFGIHLVIAKAMKR